MQTIQTKYGELVPQHTTDDLRKKEILPILHHDCGALRSLPLEEQTIIPTPAGDIPAELVTFHENGSLSRVFPLNGKLTGYWGQEDEAQMARPVTMHTPVGTITTRIIGIGFRDDASLRSITLWPGETVTIITPAGNIEARIGISFTPDGIVNSVEPAQPKPVKTMAGDIVAYDPDAVGVNGDANSLAFDGQGEVARVTTTLTSLRVIYPDGRKAIFSPEYRESLCGDSETEIVPMLVEFTDTSVVIRANPEAQPTVIPKEGHLFFTEPFLNQLMMPMGALHCSI